MREEQATTDSRYVGHTGGGLFCIFSFYVYFCCLLLLLLYLISYSLLSCLRPRSLPLPNSLSSDKPPRRPSPTISDENETRTRGRSLWRNLHFLRRVFQPRLIKGLPVVMFPSFFKTYVSNFLSSLANCRSLLIICPTTVLQLHLRADGVLSCSVSLIQRIFCFHILSSMA